MRKFSKIIIALGAVAVMGGTIAGCGSTGSDSGTGTTEATTVQTEVDSTETTTAGQETTTSSEQVSAVDYMVLVNKENALPENWEKELPITKSKNSLGDDVETESAAYEAYLALKSDLEAEGVKIDLDSAFRGVEAQQKIVDDFTKEYGEDYVKKYVAVPGFSEHHTGLALDLYLNIDGKDIIYNEDLVTYPEVWEKIHAKLADHGFILRYLEGKESITGYNYEPWHIRYIGDKVVAKEIMDKGITLEEYLNKLPQGDVTPPKD